MGAGNASTRVIGRQVRGETVSQIKSLYHEPVVCVTASRSASSSVVLAVGDASQWPGGRAGIAADGHVVFVDFHEVSENLLAELVPHLVVSPILARNFDCVDLAQLLAHLRYAGRYRAVGPPLPNPKIITREIRSLVPTLDFDVLSLD